MGAMLHQPLSKQTLPFAVQEEYIQQCQHVQRSLDCTNIPQALLARLKCLESRLGYGEWYGGSATPQSIQILV